MNLKGFFTIKKEGDGAVVDRFHFHVGLELSLSHGDGVFFEFGDKAVVEIACLLWFGGIGKGGPATSPTVCEEGELGDDEDGALDVDEGAIESPLCILEDPELWNLGGQVICIRLLVLLPYPHEAKETLLDLADNPPLDMDPGLLYPLEDGTHPGRKNPYSSSFSLWAAATMRSAILAGTSS
jgi:hypothetical protein